MKPKFKLTNETIVHNGLTLFRIEAVRDFANIKRGDTGGFVEKESNLSHFGDAWVFADAMVYGSAWVYGDALVCDAKVFGSAEVYDDAWVCDAKVYGSAWIFGDAWVCNAEVSGDARIFGDARVFGHTPPTPTGKETL